MNRMKERMQALTSLLGIEVPVILGGMAYLGRSALAAAVSNAGGLGQLACSGLNDDEALRAEIRATKALTNKPFAVNVPMSSSFGTFMKRIQVIKDEGVKIVTLGGGNPMKGIPCLKEQGFIVITVVGCEKHAKKAEEAGADILVAEGVEAGGHNNNDELTTMVLVPQVTSAVDVPVLAAGGIANGKGLAAALCLGASGVQIGTRFVLSDECIAHDHLKSALCAATDQDTFILGRADRLVARAFRTPLTERYLEKERAGNFHFSDMTKELGKDCYANASLKGDLKGAVFMAGQDIGAIDAVLPAAAIVREIMREAGEILPGIV